MTDKNQTPSPMNLLKIFFRRKHLFMIPTLAGLILGICAAIILPPKYESSTVILVEEGKTDNPLFDKIAVSSTVQQRMSGIRESILGYFSLVELIQRLKLDSDIKSPTEYNRLIDILKRNIVITLRGHNLLELSYEGRSPEHVKAIVENITDIFISKNVRMQNQETADAIAFIEKQLEVYKGKIKSAEIAKLQEKLNELLIDSTEKHPLVQQLKDQITNKKEELARENLTYYEQEPLNPQTTNPIIDEIRRALNTIESAARVPATGQNESAESGLVKMMLIDQLDKVAARDVKVNEQIYNMLLERLETAKITQRLQSSKEGTKYTILDPARLPLKPTKPNRPLVAFAGLILGCFAGIGIIMGLEFFDKSFLDVEDTKNYLGMPLLGAISKIHTDATIRAHKEHIVLIYTVTAMAAILLIILSSIIAPFMR